MRRLPALLAVLFATACGGDDESATETVTVTTATTVTITEATTETTGTTTATTTGTTPPRLPSPLPEDGELPVDAFNAYTESIDEPWERDLAAITDAFVEAGASDAQNRSFQATSAGEGSGSATASLLLDGLLDDSVRSQKYDLTLSRRQDGTWRIDTAQWSQRCQQGRGHPNFSPELCL